MKRCRVDYSGFSLQRLNDPRFSHIKLLIGWPAYFMMFFLTEHLIPPERCHVIHCWLDDLIPFCEYFAIFYVGWYALMIGSLAYTLFYDTERFRRLQKLIIIIQTIAVIIYILYPSRQDLRPQVFERSNLFTWIMGRIYTVDTSTGVCPSMHVGFSLAVLSVGLRDTNLARRYKVALAFVVGMICLAVCFVKQHSAVDVFAALPVWLAAELAVYGKDYWVPKWRAMVQKR